MKTTVKSYPQKSHLPWVVMLFFGFLMVVASSCSVTGTDDEEEIEEEIEVITDQDLRLTTAAPTVDEGNSRFTRVATTYLGAQRLVARTRVNVSAAGETKKAVARAYAQFKSKSTDASLFADINWKGTLFTAVNLSAKTEMFVRLRVRERTANGNNGPVLFTETLEHDGIGSGLKALETLTIKDSISESFQMNLKEDQVYRVEVELECNLRVDIISLSLVDCNAGTSDRGVFVNQLKIKY